MNQWQMASAGGALLRRGVEAYDQNQYHYPPVPRVQTPTAAHIIHGKRCSEGQDTEETRAQRSTSTASGSSGASYQKQNAPSPRSQWPSPTLERTLINSDYYDTRQSTQWDQSVPARGHHNQNQSETIDTNSPALAYIRQRRQIEEEDDDEEEDDHVIWVLFWLSALDPIHSLASCFFTLFVTFGLVLALPVRLVQKHNSFGDQVILTVAPLFKNHLELMYAASVEHAYEWDFRPDMLILVHIISPLISTGVAVASWVTAAFWVFTSIMGNPDGTERRDDGRDAVLAVRNWWERCLLTAIRPRVRQSMRSFV